MNVDVSNKITEAFINFNPIEVELRRRVKVAVAGGGWKWVNDFTIPAQTARLVHRNNSSDMNTRTLPDGRIVTEEARLVLLLGADVEAGDLFDHDGTTWEVSWVVSVLSTNAEVFRHGG